MHALESPITDVAPLMDFVNAPVAGLQYLQWVDETGLAVFMADRESVTVDEVVAGTRLNARGADAFLGILCGLGLGFRGPAGGYSLTEFAKEYLDRRRPYFLGASLRVPGSTLRVPGVFLKGGRASRLSTRRGGDRQSWAKRLWKRISDTQARNARKTERPGAFGSRERLEAQHCRNFPAAVVAARSPLFDGVHHLIDIAGGSGVLAIPLALAHRDLRITLVELPWALPNITPFFDRYGVTNRIELVGRNVFDTPWRLQQCDGIAFGNFMHACEDDECRLLLKETFDTLAPRGRVFIHEVLWNDRKDGPWVAASWNFWLASFTGGRQRTRDEFQSLLLEAGFSDVQVVPTAGYFSLIVATKPAVG